ncbi:MAG: ComEC/Rec2 family competence protein [Bacteroidota bacterium]
MLANHKGEIPLVVLLLPFLLGITLGLNFSAANLLIWALIPLLLSGGCFVLLNLTYSKLSVYKVRWLGGLLIHITLFFAGWLSVILHTQLNKDNNFSKQTATKLLARINNEPTIKNGVIRFTATVEQTESGNKFAASTGTLVIAIKDSLAGRLEYGDKLLIPATFTTIDPPFNPAEFNYKQYLAYQNIYHQAFLFPGQYRIVSRNNGNPVIAYSLKTRQHLVNKLKRNMLDTSAMAVASTLILGYKADLSQELLQAYSKTGTIHILSVSGGHVAIIYLILNICFSFLGRYQRGQILKAILIILLIWAYALLTGFSPAVCRAAVMISLIIIGTTYSRYINTLNILAASAIFMLLYNPLWIVDVGFQLSYLAVAGMVVLQPIIYSWITTSNKWGNKLWAACSVSIAAQVITFPLSALYFHQFPVYFLASNLFILIPAQLILFVGIPFLVLPDIPFISGWLVWILEQSILVMNKVLIIIEHAPFASIGKIWLTTGEFLLLSLSIIGLFYFLFDKKRWILTTSLVAILLVSLHTSFKRANEFGKDSITFLNLRKHRGIVFKQGDKAIILTELNPIDRNYQYSIQPYLDSIKVLDTAVYTLDKDIKSPFVMKSRNLIQFKNKKILIIDDGLVVNPLSSKLKVNYLYVTGNPHVSLNKLNENFTYDMLIIDGSNSSKHITDIVQQAKALHISYYILKGNKSLTIASN